MMGKSINFNEFEKYLMELNPNNDDFTYLINNLLDKILQEDELKIIPIIFKYFESNFLISTGNPGALTHYIESFYPSYTRELLESIKTCPTISTITMINRIVNSNLLLDERNNYLKILSRISNNKEYNSILQDEAKEIIEYQNKNMGIF